MEIRVYRYNPDVDSSPYMQSYQMDDVAEGVMLLDVLKGIKAKDETLSFRHSCGEGVCGSDAVNVNGRNVLSCITAVSDLKQPIEIRPMPGMPVIRDLIVDMSQFYHHYRSVDPYLITHDPVPEEEFLQTPAQRDKLDGLYECILCGCCTTACPSFWWNPERFRGPAALLQAYRFVADNRDQATAERLKALDGPYRLFRCHTIMNCVDACPKGLNPTHAIGELKKKMLKDSI
ncbi:MAG: succinate dehydrogenase iron-sulfur subunit [Gammaproteobacteria bacterium]|nr:MAG: succinate dehydrogenase iron-sulfur subunit [Gammaproteobacteria bacterium]